MRAGAAFTLLSAIFAAGVGQPPQERPVTPAQVNAAIDKLGSVEFPVRMEAARTVRRAPAAIAAPALRQAIASHPDRFVRFPALVLLTGFNDPSTSEIMKAALVDANDRLRAIAYMWFEEHPDKAVLPMLLAALEREESEFVRPSLTRALAAYGDVPSVRDKMKELVMRGEDLFRAEVIRALGDYRAAYAIGPIVQVAKLDGPLQDDAVLAIGKIGEKKNVEVLAGLQRTAPRSLQPSIAAAFCLLAQNCASHLGYLVETLKFAIGNPGFQDLLRATAGGLAAAAAAGNEDAAAVLFERGGPTRDPERAAIALAIGTFALRNTPLTLKVLERQQDLDGAIELIREAFDMLEEEFAEERFYVTVRRAYWQAAEGAPARRIAETLIRKLEF